MADDSYRKEYPQHSRPDDSHPRTQSHYPLPPDTAQRPPDAPPGTMATSVTLPSIHDSRGYGPPPVAPGRGYPTDPRYASPNAVNGYPPLASSLHQANLNSTFHLCNLSPILDLQPILLLRQINEVATTTNAGLPMARSRMDRITTMLTIADSPIQALHHHLTATVIILAVFTSTLQWDLAMDLPWRRQLLAKEHQLPVDTAGKERFAAVAIKLLPVGNVKTALE
ncbi:hypothetical protein NXS19_005766 [Fusarium pseudograminearum]|nr:hypothetical protein NXS19_005766 [Fusarium pseudograminearum]